MAKLIEKNYIAVRGANAVRMGEAESVDMIVTSYYRYLHIFYDIREESSYSADSG